LHLEMRYSMKTTGSMRNLDELGRVVTLMELRKVLSIKEKGPIEVFFDRSYILLFRNIKLTVNVELQEK